MQVRFMKDKDINFALELTSGEGWTDIRSDFELLITFTPPAAFVAVEAGERIGMISAVAYGRMGFIGSLIVSKMCRNRGIGTALMKHAINYLEKNGISTIMLDAVPEAAPIYESLGFRRCCKSLRLSGIPSDVEMKDVRKATEEDLPSILHLDRISFGDDRSHFLHHRFQEFPELRYVIEGEKGVYGFIMASDRTNTVRIAPWIVEGNHRSAGELVKAVASSRKGESLSIGLLETNQISLETLKKLGFQEKFFSIRMVRGTSGMPSFSDMMYSIGSPAKG